MCVAMMTDSICNIQLHVLYKPITESAALISLPHVGESSCFFHSLNITLHLSSQLLGWSVFIISSLYGDIPRASPNSLHHVAKCGTTPMLVSRASGSSSPVTEHEK